MNVLVPTLDLHDFIQGSDANKRAFSDEIGEAFQNTGFVVIRNHGLSEDLIDDLYKELRTLFGLAEQVKEKYEFPELFWQRGYTSKGKEKAKDADYADLKEFWQIGNEQGRKRSPELNYPANIVVNELPHYNPVTEKVFSELALAGKYLLQAISIYLGLEKNFFDIQVDQGNSILRGIHYFPIADPSSIPAGAVRAGAHEDINLITLLIGASADGLELLTRDGVWYPVKVEGNGIVVNVGDMLQRFTNNKLRSTTHRVVNPPPERMHESRYSVPFFLHPRSDMPLNVLKSCVDTQHPAAYDDITAGTYLEERLVEIGLKAS